jgi:tRNA dimethylallyltransferase
VNNFLIVIAGPTASGKTALSLELARWFRADILSADARQVYLELNAGTAKPSVEQLAQAPHHFINHLSIHQPYSAGQFETEATQFLSQYFLRKPVALLVGGSGLFIRAVTDGFDRFPPVNATAKELVNQWYREEGIEGLQQRLKAADPAYYQQVDLRNGSRLLRALAVIVSSGSPYSSFRKGIRKQRNFRTIKIGLHITPDELSRRISERTEEMVMKKGLISEAKELYPWRHLHALQTVGYAELFQYLEGNLSLEEAVEQIKTNTRQYARRQRTWFRKEKDIDWFAGADSNSITEFLKKEINSSASP